MNELLRRLREIVDAIMAVAEEAEQSRQHVGASVLVSNETTRGVVVEVPDTVRRAAHQALEQLMAEHSAGEMAEQSRQVGSWVRDRSVAILGEGFQARVDALVVEGRGVLAQVERLVDAQLQQFDEGQTTEARMLRASLRVRNLLEKGIAPIQVVQEAVARRDLTQLRALREELPAHAQLTAPKGPMGFVDEMLTAVTPAIDRALLDLVTPEKRELLRARLISEQYAVVLEAAGR